MSLKTKLLLVIIGALMMVGLGMGLVIYRQNTKKLSEHSYTDIRNTINYSSQLVNFFLGRAQSSLTNIADDPEIIEALDKKDPALYAQLQDKLTGVTEAGFIENIRLHEIIGAKCIARSSDEESFSIIVGLDFSDREYCQAVIKTKAPYLSAAFMGIFSKEPALGLIVPIKGVTGQLLGYVEGIMNLNDLRGYLWDLQDSSSKVELLDRNGIMFLNTEEKISSLGNLPGAEVSELMKIKSALAGGKSEGYFRDVDNFVGYKYNGSVTVIYEKSAASLLALSRTLNLTVIFSLVIAIVFTVVIVYFLIGSVTRRISRLSRIAKQIAGGNFDFKFNEEDLRATDETGLLVRAFNDMAIRLADLYKGLEDKVKERTREAEEKTKKLEASEGEIKKALESSEKANKLMVGRELEMVKLKERIKELEK